MTRSDDNLPWPPPAHKPSRAELIAPATQIVRDREDYLGQGIRDVGRRIADDQLEMFVTVDPAAALLQQFERLAPEFIAVHDVGTSTSLRLLGSLAGAAGARIQRLSIRRQGQGVALAVLQFVEVPLGDGRQVRVYTTDVNADSLSRRALAEVLLSRARLSVLLVGELPPHALNTALKPLQEALQRGTWPNTEMLLLPLGSATALAAQASQLVGATPVNVRITPQAARPEDAWSFISGAWNRLNSASGPAAALATDLDRAVPRPPTPRPEAPTQPMGLAPTPPHAAAPTPSAAVPMPRPPLAMRPMPPVPGAAAPAAGSASRWAGYAARCAGIKGVISCCVFDLGTQRPLAHVGGLPTADVLALQGALLIDSIGSSARALGLGGVLPEAAISMGQQHLILKPVPGHPGLVLHLVLQATANNLTLARLQLERVPV